MVVRFPPPSARTNGGTQRARGAEATDPTRVAHLEAAEGTGSEAPALISPSHGLGGAFNGYTFEAKHVDAVMKKYGIGDVKALLRTAIVLHASARPGRVLTLADLEAAGKQEAAYVSRGLKFSPTVLADVMKQSGIAEQSALLRAARRVDDDSTLTRDEIESAAGLLNTFVRANDVDEVNARLDAWAAAGLTVETLAHVDGEPIRALTLPAKNQPPKHRVLVTGGVHGNEPCGSAAAILVAEEALRMSALREDVEIVIVPLVNPRGMRAETRRTPEDIDLNRSFHGHEVGPAETEAMEAFLAAQQARGGRFDLTVDLHSGKANRNGFWLLHDDSEKHASFAMRRFRETWPALTQQEAEPYVLSSPGIAESDNEGTLKAFARATGAKASFTVEAPGSVSYLDQVLGEAELVFHLIDATRAGL